MLKVRIIPVLTIKDERLVKSVQFEEHRNIGSYIAAVRVFNARDVDEMVVLDLDARKNGIKKWLFAEIAKECFMPLTLGGGVKTIDDVQGLLQAGGDKVSVNSEAVHRPEFITEIARTFGAQCVVLSIDVKKVNGKYEVFIEGGKTPTGLDPVEWAKEGEKRGAGEILLTSIDHDGMMDGYDIPLVKKVSEAVHIPVIAAGGAGNLEDARKVVIEGKATAVAAASIFQYTQITPVAIREYLRQYQIQVRS